MLLQIPKKLQSYSPKCAFIEFVYLVLVMEYMTIPLKFKDCSQFSIVLLTSGVLSISRIIPYSNTGCEELLKYSVLVFHRVPFGLLYYLISIFVVTTSQSSFNLPIRVSSLLGSTSIILVALVLMVNWFIVSLSRKWLTRFFFVKSPNYLIIRVVTTYDIDKGFLVSALK